MNAPKRWLLGLYCGGTLPYRLLAAARRSAAGAVPIMVLFYHRVADSQPNPWTMTNRQFARQIRWLHRRFDLVSLAEAQRRICSGRCHRPTVSVTFDDGYADNCTGALPLLIDLGIPCTYFVSTHQVLDGVPFPHDVAAAQPLPVNTAAQLRWMVAHGIEVGAHTQSHADIGAIADPVRLAGELVTCKHQLEAAVNRPVRYFAFPYGQPENMTDEAFHLAREAGYQGICSAYGGYNFPGDDAFHLRRIHADPEMVRFRNWLAVDPRKVWISSRKRLRPGAIAGPTPAGGSA